MSVRKAIHEFDGLYYITITNCRWIPLFDIADSFHAVYKWFDYLKDHGHYIAGYVIMPNHLHALIAFRNTNGRSINSLIGNGKRFMAYEIISSLKAQKADELLEQLASYLNETERNRGKLHEVFEPSFDCKECYSDYFIEQKLHYIHQNPCKGVWDLARNAWEYQHSSAKFYMLGEQSFYPVTSYADLKDIDLTKPRG